MKKFNVECRFKGNVTHKIMTANSREELIQKMRLIAEGQPLRFEVLDEVE